MAHAKHAEVARSWDAVLPVSGSAVRVVVGRPLEDCKSYLIGTLVFPVRTAREAHHGVAMVRDLQLLAGADHYIAAFQAADGSCFEDDDGEERGGATLAAVLSRERVMGCVVVVARWLGGVALDQRLFTHIEQRARLLLQAVGQRCGDTMTLEDNTVGAGAPEPTFRNAQLISTRAASAAPSSAVLAGAGSSSSSSTSSAAAAFVVDDDDDEPVVVMDDGAGGAVTASGRPDQVRGRAPAPKTHAEVAQSWDAVLPGSLSAVRIVVGRRLEDSKSYFIGVLLFPVRTAQEAKNGIAMVRQLELLASADHLIAAFQAADRSCFQDDDGEERGGATLANVLSRDGVVGCVVVIARWFGGVLLHQRRFAHIEQRARLLLQAVGQRRGITMNLEENTVGAGAPQSPQIDMAARIAQVVSTRGASQGSSSSSTAIAVSTSSSSSRAGVAVVVDDDEPVVVVDDGAGSARQSDLEEAFDEEELYDDAPRVPPPARAAGRGSVVAPRGFAPASESAVSLPTVARVATSVDSSSDEDQVMAVPSSSSAPRGPARAPAARREPLRSAKSRGLAPPAAALAQAESESDQDSDRERPALRRRTSAVSSKASSRRRATSRGESEDSDGSREDDELESEEEAEEGEDGLLRRETHELDYSGLVLKPHHKYRPLWVCPSGRLLLEASSRVYKQAYDLCVAVAEPASRPRFVHEYRLTPYSLYAAVSIGLTTEEIIQGLDRISKVELPQELVSMICASTANFGKAKLVLKSNSVFVESASKAVLERLLEIGEVRAARKEAQLPQAQTFQRSQAAVEDSANISRIVNIVIEEEPYDVNEDDTDHDYLMSLMSELEAEQEGGGAPAAAAGAPAPAPAAAAAASLAPPQEEAAAAFVYSFEVDPSRTESVRRAALKEEFPLMEEYEFNRDTVNASLAIQLKASVEIRPYQELSLKKMFGNGRARSGIIVLPCGAGKTLTGITACCTIKKDCIVLCTGGVAASQWKKQFLDSTTISPKHLYTFTSKEKNEIDKSSPCVLITTYSMMARRLGNAKSSRHTVDLLRAIFSREWGLMLLDEVHVAPASIFRKVLTNVKAHCKLGLTATLVREDELIDDLNFLIGPKLYEANWHDLTAQGYLAHVECQEVRCPMTEEFFGEYLHERSMHVKQLLYTLNPNKILAAEYLARMHEAKGDKVLVFCDNLEAVSFFARLLSRPFIAGDTPYNERMRLYTQFRKSSVMGTLVLSKVGDLAIDLPEATVIIQVSSHFGSRRQEAQRLGRILRPKNDRCRSGANFDANKFDAHFYTLVSSNTEEVRYAAKRQQYLVDQGYSYKVRTDVCGIARAALQKHQAQAGAPPQPAPHKVAGVAPPPPHILQLLSRVEQLKLLQRILAKSASAHQVQEVKSKGSSAGMPGRQQEEEEQEEEEEEAAQQQQQQQQLEHSDSDQEVARPAAKRRKADVGQLSGAGTLQYMEYSNAQDHEH